MSRLVNTPKLHIGDIGLAAALLGINASDLAADRELLGQFLETFVYQELRWECSGHADDIRFHHFRDKDGYEVDLYRPSTWAVTMSTFCVTAEIRIILMLIHNLLINWGFFEPDRTW